MLFKFFKIIWLVKKFVLFVYFLVLFGIGNLDGGKVVSLVSFNVLE